jgi:predicted DNA binding CopG/RHH family protein
MEETCGITVKVPAALHSRVRTEQESLEMTMSSYITMVLEEHFNPDRKGGNNMNGTRTLAFQVSEELLQRIKDHLARNPGLTQKSFVIGLIEQALKEAEGETSE